VDGLRSQYWGDQFSVGVWFKRTGQTGNYQGIVNNGYYGSGSFEIRMGREHGGQMVGGGVLTPTHKQSWDHVGLKAALNTWHHVVMTYDGKKLDFYLNGLRWKDSTTKDKGALLVKDTPLFIGQAGTGTGAEYFNGYIKDVKIWTRAFSTADVYKEFGVNKNKLQAHYPLKSNANDAGPRGLHGKWQGSTKYSGGAAFFNGKSKIVVDGLRSQYWGDQFSVGVWFKRTGQTGNYQGIVNNGYYGHGSFEIRMGRENGGQMVGGGVLTSSHKKAWDHVGLKAPLNKWNHVVMTYNGKELNFYLNKVTKKATTKDKGILLNKNNPLVIGQAGHGSGGEYFYGYIKDVKIWSRALSAADVAAEFANK